MCLGAQFGLAALVAPLTGLAGPHSALPLLTVMGVSAAVVLVALWAMLRGVSRPAPAT